MLHTQHFSVLMCYKTSSQQSTIPSSWVWKREKKENKKEIVSKLCTPQCILAFSAAPVDLLHPLHRSADAAAGPVEGSNAHIACLSLPLAIYGKSWSNQHTYVLFTCIKQLSSYHAHLTQGQVLINENATKGNKTTP